MKKAISNVLLCYDFLNKCMIVQIQLLRNYINDLHGFCFNQLNNLTNILNITNKNIFLQMSYWHN